MMLTKAMYDMLTERDREENPVCRHHMERYESKVRAIDDFAAEATGPVEMTAARVRELLMHIAGLE